MGKTYKINLLRFLDNEYNCVETTIDITSVKTISKVYEGTLRLNDTTIIPVIVKKENKTFKQTLPYGLNHFAYFKDDGEKYYIYKKYDMSIESIFEKGGILGGCDAAEKEKRIAKIIIAYMLTIHSIIKTYDMVNLDLKPDNGVLNIDGNQMNVKLVDYTEFLSATGLTETSFTEINACATLKWLCPALLKAFVKRKESMSEIDGKLVKFADIYSMGHILVWLYSEGGSIYKEPWSIYDFWDVAYKNTGNTESLSSEEKEKNDRELNYYKESFGDGFDDEQKIRFFDNAYVTLYQDYDSLYLDAKNKHLMMKNIDPEAEFKFAANPVELFNSVIKPMLSKPKDNEDNLECCEQVIKAYCKILYENNRLPDMDIPDVFLPKQYIKSQKTKVCLQMVYETKSLRDDACFKWTEYKFCSLSEGDSDSIPLFFIKSTNRDYNRTTKKELLYLSRYNGEIYYRITKDDDITLSTPNFGKLDNIKIELQFGKTTLHITKK